MDKNSCSMTPPNSPLLQFAMLDDDMLIPEESIESDQNESSSIIFCCTGEPIPFANTNRGTFLQNGIIEKLRQCGKSTNASVPHTVNLFDNNFDFKNALIGHQETVFSLARSAISYLEEITLNSNNFTQKGEVTAFVKIRHDVKVFFDYVILWLKSIKNEKDFSVSMLLNNVMMLSVYIGRLHELPLSIISQSAYRQGNKCSYAGYHYFHMCLEVHWSVIETVYTLTTLYPEVVNNNLILYETACQPEECSDVTAQLLMLIMWDLVWLSAHRYQGISASELQRISPFSCSCVCELTIMIIQTVSMRQHQLGHQSFWSHVTVILKQLLVPPESVEDSMEIDSYQTIVPIQVNCDDLSGFAWYYLLHLTPLFNYNELGNYSNNQTPLPNNYSLVQFLLKNTLLLNESSIRLHLRLCLNITSYWESNTGFIALLWEHFYKKLNDVFRTQTADMMGHACIKKSSSMLYETCRQLAENNMSGLEQDNSYHIFLRMLSQYLTKSGQPNQSWKQIKGRFYSKFHASRVQMLTEVGLQNLSSLFLVLGFLVDTSDISLKLCELLLMVRDQVTVARRTSVWKGLQALVHLHQHKSIEAGYITEKLSAEFDSIVREFYEMSDTPQVSANMWHLITLYLDSTVDIIEASDTLSLQEYLLVSPGLRILCDNARTHELMSVLNCVLALINKLRFLQQQTPGGMTGLRGLADGLWLHVYSFVKQHSTTQTPPSILADIATGFCLLSITMPPTIHTGLKEDFSKCFWYFALQANSIISCRFLVYCLQDSDLLEALAKSGRDPEPDLIQAWFRCHWFMLNESESLQNLAILLQDRPLMSDVLRAASPDASHQESVCRFLSGLEMQYSSLQDSRTKSEFRELVEKYFGDVGKYLSAQKTSGSSDLTKQVYYIAGLMVKCCAPFIYSNMMNCLLPVLVDKLVLPRSLVVQGKELPNNALNALREHLHLFLSGLGRLEYRSDAYVQRKIRDMFTIYFTKFPLVASNTVDAAYVHPFVAAICDDKSSFRQYILQLVIQEYLTNQNKNSILQGQQFIFELFRKSKLNFTANDCGILLPVLLSQLLEAQQPRPQQVKVICTLLEACSIPACILPREEAAQIVLSVIEQLLPQYQSRVFKHLEGIVSSYTQLFVEILAQMTQCVRHNEIKRGHGKDKHLRFAYCSLLQKLGSAGAEEKSKILLD